MQHFFKLVLSASIAGGLLQILSAQDLAPRAYIIAPLHSNAVTLVWSFYDGSINYNGALPVSDATGTYSVPILSYYHSFDFFGRSANVVASLPYGVGNFEGTVSGAGDHLYRSGLVDSVFRLSSLRDIFGGQDLLPTRSSLFQGRAIGLTTSTTCRDVIADRIPVSGDGNRRVRFQQIGSEFVAELPDAIFCVSNGWGR